MHLVPAFFTGVFLFNAIPHLSQGLSGKAFPTPFARPRGIGLSSPLANVYWGAFNLLCGGVLAQQAQLQPGLNADFAAACAGALLLGSYLARHFGRLHAPRAVRED